MNQQQQQQESAIKLECLKLALGYFHRTDKPKSVPIMDEESNCKEVLIIAQDFYNFVKA